jgi:precorrin-2 dehydrogenase/sirohydrochlorin ferrochelatase
MRVIAPNICEAIRTQPAEHQIELLERSYSVDDIHDAFLVIAATSSSAVNAQVSEDCTERGILVSDAETPERGDFHSLATVRRGRLQVAVTTSGASPMLAMRLRDTLSDQFGPEWDEYTKLLAELRVQVIQNVANRQTQREALTRLAEDAEVLDLIRQGRHDEARQKALQCISSL